jgi:hypothetical protein
VDLIEPPTPHPTARDTAASCAQGVEALGQASMPHLTTLNLASNPLGAAAGAAAGKLLAAAPQLQRLLLGSTGLSDEGGQRAAVWVHRLWCAVLNGQCVESGLPASSAAGLGSSRAPLLAPGGPCTDPVPMLCGCAHVLRLS